jgi:hypothetical protein
VYNANLADQMGQRRSGGAAAKSHEPDGKLDFICFSAPVEGRKLVCGTSLLMRLMILHIGIWCA